MKKVLLYLLLSPFYILSQTNNETQPQRVSDSSSFYKIDFIDVGKISADVDDQSRSTAIIRSENITDLRTSKITNAVAIFIYPFAL